MTFKKWLLKFTEVDLPIGDIARDVKKDKDFPDGNSRDAIFEHLKKQGIINSAMVTFENAWSYYLSERGPI